MHWRLDKKLAAILLAVVSPPLLEQTAVVVDFPDGAAVYMETELAVIDVGDPANLGELGRIAMPFNVQGQRVLCAVAGRVNGGRGRLLP